MASLRSDPIRPPRLSKARRRAMAVEVHVAEHYLRVVVTLLDSEIKQPPRLNEVFGPALALHVHSGKVGPRRGAA